MSAVAIGRGRHRRSLVLYRFREDQGGHLMRDATRIHGPRQLTDIYLLALAVKQKGRLVTFDTGVPLALVRKATADNLVAL